VDLHSGEFKAQKEDFFSRKQAENAGKRDDLPPSQGGKYAGFGNAAYNPPPRSMSTDFYDSSLSGITNVSLDACSVCGRVHAILL
jgi:ADP-ribosylation factor GTPase-activating protein 1